MRLDVTYQNVSEESKQHWNRDVITPLLFVRSMKRDRQRHEEREKVWRGREEQGLGAVVSQSSDNRREKVVEGLGCNEGHLQNDKHVQFAVFKRLF